MRALRELVHRHTSELGNDCFSKAAFIMFPNGLSDMYSARAAEFRRNARLGGLRGLGPAAFSRAIEVPFKGSTMRVIGREDFIAMKMKAFAGGPQDIADARNALLLGRDSLDVKLLRALAQRYGREAATVLENLIEDTLGTA